MTTVAEKVPRTFLDKPQPSARTIRPYFPEVTIRCRVGRARALPMDEALAFEEGIGSWCEGRKAKQGKAVRMVYFFGVKGADGNASMKNLLGGKGAKLAEMSNLGLPVPAGFTITTDVCTHFYANGRRYPGDLKGQVGAPSPASRRRSASASANPTDPLLVSVRSGPAPRCPA